MVKYQKSGTDLFISTYYLFAITIKGAMSGLRQF